MGSLTIRLPRTFVFAVLASIYTVAFVISPYWILASSLAGRIALLTVTIGLGALWSYLSADELRIRFGVRSLVLFIILLLGVIALNYGPLTSVIPWRGDEGTHISKVLYLITVIPVKWILYVLLFLALILYCSWHRPKWAIAMGVALVVSVIVFFFLRGNVLPAGSPTWILHYPLINYWLYLVAPRLAALSVGPYHEILYRIVPVISMTVLAWTFQRAMADTPGPADLLWGFAVATMPVVFYYSSILYIEPPAILLMLIVCLHFKDLVRDDYTRIRKNPAWYALILIGFIKETTIIFLFCFVVCRTAYHLLQGRLQAPRQMRPGTSLVRKPEESLLRLFARELAVVFSIFFPYLLFVILRSTFTTVRSFAPDVSSLLDPSVYRAVGQSLLEQFGLILVPFLAGCFLLVRKRDTSTLSFVLLLFLATLLFYAVDSHGIFAGYSRFNLFILPAVLAGASVFLKQAAGRKKFMGAVMAGAIISANLLMSPVNIDGTKVPFWGNYLYDISEHYYPYQEALSWLKATSNHERVLFAGMDDGYYFDFYFDKLDWHPRRKVDQVLLSGDPRDEFVLYFDNSRWSPQRELDQFLRPGPAQGESDAVLKVLDLAAQNNFTVVVYHVLGKDIPQVQATGYFQAVKVFRNQAHILVVYSAAP